VSITLHDGKPKQNQYLSGILHAVETSGCASQAVATTTNAWMTAFNIVYTTVATDCHLPQGKNRHHKFKDKIVEVWQAMVRPRGILSCILSTRQFF